MCQWQCIMQQSAATTWQGGLRERWWWNDWVQKLTPSATEGISP